MDIFRKIPTEILILIFLETVGPNKISIRQSPLNLISVCQRWRLVALNIHGLWRYFSASDQVSVNAPPDLLLNYLRKSSVLTISLDLIYKNFVSSISNITILTLLGKAMRYIEGCSLNFPNLIEFRVDAQSISLPYRTMTNCGPGVQKISISAINNSEDRFYIHKPSFEELEYLSLDFWCLDVRDLQYFSSSSLRRLILKIHRCISNRLEAGQAHNMFPGLTYLEIFGQELMHYPSFDSIWNFQHLECLVLNSWGDFEDIVKNLILHHKRLRKLKIQSNHQEIYYLYQYIKQGYVDKVTYHCLNYNSCVTLAWACVQSGTKFKIYSQTLSFVQSSKKKSFIHIKNSMMRWPDKFLDHFSAFPELIMDNSYFELESTAMQNTVRVLKIKFQNCGNDMSWLEKLVFGNLEHVFLSSDSRLTLSGKYLIVLSKFVKKHTNIQTMEIDNVYINYYYIRYFFLCLINLKRLHIRNMTNTPDYVNAMPDSLVLVQDD